MARNLSSLIPDAFAIYSAAYEKIGEIGYSVAQLDGSPLQPRKINQLIEATNLFSVVAPSIVINDGGTAIIAIVGDISLVNDILLKLKRSVGLFSLPGFPTPLTIIELINACECDSGGGTGGCSELVQVDTSQDPMVFDMDGQCDVLFYGSADIDGQRTWSVTNPGEATGFQFSFVIDGSLDEASHDQTFPANFKMSDARYNAGTKKWRPYEAGEYLAKATTFNNGLTWKLEISDVFT